MMGPLRCKLELSFYLQQSAFRKMEQIYFAIFGLRLTREILSSHERSPATSTGLEHWWVEIPFC